MSKVSKKCFVIMPYGGDDPATRKHFDGIYQSIIVPGALRADYEVKRSDTTSEPGNITHDIIRDLADADVVIADLTTGNANVFFELGIRHAFRKSGTVHMVDAAHKLPFDLRQYRVIEYSTDLAEVPEAIQAIAEAILRRSERPNRPDNPVHDAIPDLPLDFRSTGDAAMRKQLETTERELEELRRENEALAKKIGALDPTGSVTDEGPTIDVGVLLDEADAIMESTGEHAILKLRQALDGQGAKAFAKELRNVLDSPYLDENDFAEINILCKRSGLEGHRRATLEVARARYPYSEEMLLHFLDALDDSPNPEDQERGRLMIEQRLGIEHGEGGPRFSGDRASLPLRQSLLLLFNFYNRAGKYEWIIGIADCVPHSLENDPMILRNKARSLAQINRQEEAEAVYRHALQIDPADDQTILWYASFLDDQGKTAEAYEESEKALLADPDDPRMWIHMAIQVYNRGYYRTKSGRIEGPFPRKARVAALVPFGVKAAELSSSAEQVQEVVRVLVRGDAIDAAQAVASGQTPVGDFDTTPVDYLLTKMAEKQENGQ
jgi:tetratricopeptide (TPR) repeat protein